MSPSDAKTILLRAGLDIRSIETPSSGVTRSIFFCDIGGEPAYVTLLYAKDCEIMHFLHKKIGQKTVVPLANILGSGHDEQSNYSYLIQASAGQNLEKLRNKQKLFRDAGKHLRKIHSVELPGFGKIIRDKTGKFRGRKDSWPEFLRTTASAKKIDYLTKNAILNGEQGRIVARTLDEFSDATPKPGVLLHGDYNRGNLCSDGDKVTAIIDWEKATVGIAEYDLAIAEYRLGSNFSELLIGYGQGANLGNVQKYSLLFAVHLVFLALTKQPTRFMPSKKALDAALAHVAIR